MSVYSVLLLLATTAKSDTRILPKNHMNKKYFLELAQYNIWANQKMINWLSQISEEQWSQKLVGSFDSIETTAIHTAGAEKVWFERLNNQAQPFLTLTFKGNKSDLIEI